MKNVLIVAAHPDDEVLGCGGTIARHVAQGDAVSVLFLSSGVGSRRTEPGGLPGTAAIERGKAADAAARILGHDWYYSAGSFRDQEFDKAGVLALARAIEGVFTANGAPQIIYTHWLGDLNVDHRLTAQAVLTAFRPVPGSSVDAIYGFEVPSSTEWGLEPFVPDYFVEIDRDAIAKKQAAVHAYVEEMRTFPHARSEVAVSWSTCVRGCSVGLERAEAFHTYRKVWRP